MELVTKRSSRVIIIWSQQNYWVILVMLCVMLGKYLELLSVSVMLICLIDDWLIDWLSYNYYYTGLLPGRVTYVIGKLCLITFIQHSSSLSTSLLLIIMHHHDHAGKDGKVLSIYDDLANAQVHPDKALEVLVKK